MANRSKPSPAHSSPSTGDAASFNAASTPLPDFPIVGIGCSAGGLEALGVLLSGAPPDSGMAFIVVQHLDPEHPSNLPELLQRDTPMPVVEASDGMLVRPDCVYVIPPNKDLSLLHGALHLLDPTEKRGLRLPIDFFLRTLADDRQENAVGVILSAWAPTACSASAPSRRRAA
jgi:two-component system CheB/CheR fusion protein